MTSDVEPSWLQKLPGSQDLRHAFVGNYVKLADAMRADLASHPLFGPMFSGVSDEVQAEYDAKVEARLEAAFDGDWTPYADGLRKDGARYAHLGLSFPDWFSLVTGFVRPLLPIVFELYGHDAHRLEQVLEAMHQFRDRATVLLAGSFIDASESKIRQHEAELRIWEARATALEAENGTALEASRLKSEFLANMSHELRTPLNSIIGFSQLLEQGEVGPLSEQQHDFVSDIHRSGQHLLRLINDILDLSKIEAGKLEFVPTRVSLSTVAAEVVRAVRIPPHEQLHVRVSFEPGLDEVHLDPTRLKQVLYNYLSNAVKHTTAVGGVDLRFTLDDASSFRIEVEDYGLGISEADQRRLFTDFEQLDIGRAKRHGGAGLGLALTRRLVEDQGGRVGLHSVEGRGSTFFAVLPLRFPFASAVASGRSR